MATYLEIHPENPQVRLLRRAAGILREGGLIAYPTDSCHAIGCSLDNKEGIERIIRLRQLDSKHHFTLMCRDFAQLGQFVEVDNAAFRTIKSLTPGPYTFILRATKEVPRRMMHPKKLSVGARIPDHRVAQGLVEEMGEPILSSTLLLPGEEEPLTEGWRIQEEIGSQLDGIIDADVPGTEPTTVIDYLDGRAPVVVRRGAGDTSRFE
ncbi:L-threonylcarbamoyladenylate synthase [Sediminivirga luteola]|uniref:Threonylcarbamoyl-AMP synthase n=1 Tax=Sediminivirga luteola TaxID=1774748 RepID=A0A8J2U0E2_9MICO|nr:L-threonylcarbamoyladenylate synthase [Sediminivirga luteola]MCI2265377.1 threonylcarbamoyl-AMP synthase [Sediminivirga luteola]GGA24440.1 threonylcarbamoyl-AMP synthase [Sediminivirga luteola]